MKYITLTALCVFSWWCDYTPMASNAEVNLFIATKLAEYDPTADVLNIDITQPIYLFGKDGGKI